MNIGNADIHEAADQIGIGGDAERDRWFVGRRTTPGIDEEPRVRDLDVPRRAFAVAPAQNATSKDRFVKSKRSLDVGDREKVCDGNPILRRHLIGFLLDLYFAHGWLLFGLGDIRLRGTWKYQPISQIECLAKNARMRLAISSFFSSKAKWPASSRWISASGRSRSNASAPGAMNERSFRAQTTKVGGLCSRNHPCHTEYKAED